MIPVAELERLAKERLDDAEALHSAERFDGAVYICGYALEFALKARICKTLDWTEYRTTDEYRSLKTHSLDVLLRFSGVERRIKKQFELEWSLVTEWSPEQRYDHTRSATADSAQQMLDAARRIMAAL